MKIPAAKGTTLHERLFDPQQFRFQFKKDFNQQSKDSFAGITPDLFVGRWGYPKVRMGLLSSQSISAENNPLSWAKEKTTIQDILKTRMSLVNAGGSAHVKLPSSKDVERIKDVGQEAAMSVKALDTDVSLDQKPQFRLHLKDNSLPHGPQAQLKNIKVTSNAKIPKSVYKVTDDGDLKATGGINSLWRKGFPEHQLSRLLSSGTMGTKLERRLVPTRWGITAVDDMVGKNVHKNLSQLKDMDYSFFFGGHMGNYFALLFFPGSWSFDLFENYSKDATLSTQYNDYEGFKGRKSYASNTAGGYYAARLPVLEYLQEQKCTSSVLALRFITPEYWAPLGVWVVREAVRKALSTKIVTFADEQSLLHHARETILSEFNLDIQTLFDASTMLKERKSQTSLLNFT